jgi:hypothetical protein
VVSTARNETTHAGMMISGPRAQHASMHLGGLVRVETKRFAKGVVGLFRRLGCEDVQHIRRRKLPHTAKTIVMGSAGKNARYR